MKPPRSSLPKSQSPKSRVVLVTGGRGRIGGALVRELVEAGDSVVVIDKGPVPPITTHSSSSRVTHLRADLSIEREAASAFQAIRRKFQRIDSAVLAAGDFVYKPLVDQTAADLQRMLNNNVIAAFSCLRELASAPGSAGARVVILGSIVDHRVIKGNSTYGSAKAALRMLVDVAREEFRDTPMRITNLCLGAVASPMTVQLGKRKTSAALSTIAPVHVIATLRWILDAPRGPRLDEVRLFPQVGVNLD
jgi:NAD(P)-dependent dehydrogenase (short-subunit alcohol dehydrogenase family)